MQTPRCLRLPALLSLFLVAALAGCDQNAPTETRAPSRPTQLGPAGEDADLAAGDISTAGGRAYAHVSWQVTGVQHDAYAEEHRIRVEEEKSRAEGELVARR